MSDDRLKPLDQLDEIDPLGSVDELASQKIPDGSDRRTFLMRSALIGATAIITDRPVTAQQRAARATGTPPTPQLSPTLNVVKEQKGPVMTTVDEFYKVGPGPSSSHTVTLNARAASRISGNCGVRSSGSSGRLALYLS